MLRWKRGVHMKMRTFLYRLVGAVIVLLGLALLFKFWYSKFFISVSTVIVIIGVAVFMMAPPRSHTPLTELPSQQPKTEPDFLCTSSCAYSSSSSLAISLATIMAMAVISGR